MIVKRKKKRIIKMNENQGFDGLVLNVKIPDIMEISDGKKKKKYKQLYKLLDELSPKTSMMTVSINQNCPIKKIVVDVPKNYKDIK
jgi:hypothetical protein